MNYDSNGTILLEDISRVIVFTIDQFQINFRSISDQFQIIAETMEEYMIKIDSMTNKMFIKVLKFIKIAR
jgi:hypothetical protein